MAEGEAMKISVGRWPKGIIASDEEYAKVAYLYTETLLTNKRNSHIILAMAMQVPVSTVKERIRTCKQRGLLTIPGHGKRAMLTLKACTLLKENE